MVTFDNTRLKKVKVWKMEWYKNITKTGGSMKQCIDECKQNEVVIHSETQNKGKMWATIEPEKLLNLLEQNNGIYEVITKFPHQVYFDLETYVDRLYSVNEVTELLNNCKIQIEELFPNGDMAISGSVTDKKISFHIVLNNYVIHNEGERDMIRAIVKYLKEKNKDDIFDWKVYTKNRNMKAINQSKRDGRVQQIIENEDWKKHLITCYVNNYPLQFPEFKNEIKEEIMIQKVKGKFDIGLLPKLNKVTPKEITWSTITAKEVVDLLPCNKDFSHDYTHKVARFCHSNGIEFEYFLSWISQKHTNLTSDIKNKWLYHWNNLHKYPKCNIESMKSILAYYYPDIKKNIHLREFKELFDLPNDIKLTNIERLGQEHYNDNYKVTILHLGMGSGKTAQTIDYLHKNNNFCWIGHRQSLHQNTLQRIKQAGLECVDYQSGTAKTKSQIYKEAFALSICVNSLHYVPDEKEFDCVVIDEIESLLDSYVSDFMKEKKYKNFDRLCKLIKSAEKVILIDAFITRRTIEFIRAIDKNIKIDYVVSKVKLNKSLYFKNSVRDEEEDTWDEINGTKDMALVEIAEELKNDEKVFIFYPYKKDMPQIHAVLEKATKKKGIYYNADIDDDIKDTLKCVNEVWSQYDFVITNSCITCGVNYDKKMFDSVWIFLANFVKPREAIQVSARVRYLNTDTINVVMLGNLRNPSVYEDDREKINHKVYNNVFKNALIEDKAPRRKAFEIFCSKAGYKMSKESFILNKEISGEMKKLFEETDVTMTFENIEKIDSGTAEELQNIVIGHTSTMYDRLCLQKFFYLQKFNANVNEDILAIAWNNEYKDFFEKYKEINNGENIFKEIQQTNKWELIFPEEKFKEVKIDEKTMDKIFTLYNFRTLNRSSSKNMIYREIINKTFNKNIIQTKQDGTKNIQWCLCETFNEYKNDFIEASSCLV